MFAFIVFTVHVEAIGILECIFRKWDVGLWTGLGWLRIETGGGHLLMR
jgi:hypothetical protein